MTSQTPEKHIRLDKWLWAARFFKTRQLAIKAIKNGRITLNKQTLKPASTVKLDDQIDIKSGPYIISIVIIGLSEQRGSATVARGLYQETEESITQRQQLKQQLANQPKIQHQRNKPDKRSVRSNRALKRGE